MASPDHLSLSNYIKSVHQKLRNDSKVLGPEKAWQKHCEDEDSLEKYASAMQKLAVNHWDHNFKNTTTAVSRVEWIYEFTKKYFYEEEILKQRLKEIGIAQKINLVIDTVDTLILDDTKLQVLDVGSCYNPFKMYPEFNVTPIDIAPANEEVYKCDFLNVKLTAGPTSVTNFEIDELQNGSFHVVVFSLLLEYLPSPSQRHLCCENAYNLLKPEGILIIITPDSKHVGANAKIMKTWRFILAKMGFSRIKYEKLSHLHCMVFQKSLKKEVAQRWAFLQEEKQFYNEIYIPQDFMKIDKADVPREQREYCDISLFAELPCITDEKQ